MPVIASYTSGLASSTTPKNVAITSQAGDLIIVLGGGENEAITLSTPSGNSISFTLRQSVVVNNFATAYVWTGVDATGGTNWSMSATAAGGGLWGYTVLVIRSAAGVGNSVKNNASGTAAISITTTDTDSVIAVFNADWNAVNGDTRVWNTVNGVTPTAGNNMEMGYGFSNGAYTAYSAYYTDTGAAGSKSVGLSQPTGQKYSIVAIEIPLTAPVVTATTAWLTA